MLKKNCFLIASLALFCYKANAQYLKPQSSVSAKTETNIGVKSEEKHAALMGEVSLMNTASNLNPHLTPIGIYHEEDEGNIKDALKVSADKLPLYIEDGKNASHEKMAAETPTVFRNYTGYTDSKYTPPDNSIAVNNDGIVISAMNSNIRLYKYSGQLIKVTSFFDVFKAQFPSFKQTFYDPKVIYDSGSDRFILVVLHGNQADSSRIMVMFSKTSNPQDGWNFYALDGDVLGKNQWTDYPNIGVSNNELYITGNLFNNNFYYQEPFILQINKNDGYQAKELGFQAWSGIRDQTGNPSFTLVPVPYGQQGNYGPGTYFVSNEQNNSSSVNLFELTDDMSSSNEKLQRTTIANPFTYSIPNYSSQKGTTDLLNSGDTRIKHAFFLDNTIHYVYTSLSSNNNNSIVYCRLNVKNHEQDYRSLGKSGMNYNYPSIASLGTDDKDKSVLIGFLSSNATTYPEMRVVHCDDNFEFSTSVVIQAGKSGVNILNDNVERWGDYTGMARKYSKTSCLFAGSYGNNSSWSTRIAEVGLTSNKVGVEEVENTLTASDDANVYPNPIVNEFSVNFKLRKQSHIVIQLYDMQGRITETLYSGTEREGEKNFSFNTASLASGIYTLYIRSAENTLAVKKVVVK